MSAAAKPQPVQRTLFRMPAPAPVAPATRGEFLHEAYKRPCNICGRPGTCFHREPLVELAIWIGLMGGIDTCLCGTHSAKKSRARIASA